MKRDEHDIPRQLDRYLGRHGEPSREYMVSALERVRQTLDPGISQMTNPLPLESTARNNRLFPLAAAAVVMVIVGSVVLVRMPISQKSANIIAEWFDGTLLSLRKQSPVAKALVGQGAQRLEFSVVSIKPIPPHGTLAIISNGGSIGLACHGTDGMPRAPFGGGAGPITVPQGRCLGVAVDLAWLITYAYETPWRYGPNVPEWARSGERPVQSDLFQIEAAAEDPATATTAQLRQMLQAMLADRFKLKVHRETQEVQGYALVIAKNGPKLKPTDELEPPHFGPGIRGKSSLDELAQFLTQFVIAFANLGSLDGPFVNKTGLTGAYDYEFRLSRAGGPGVRGETPGGPPPTRLERAADTVEAISAGMEAQLGLRLQPEKMPADVIVIDQVEKPAPN